MTGFDPLRSLRGCRKPQGMAHNRTFLFALLLTACGQSGPTNHRETVGPVEASQDDGFDFLKMAKGDPWARLPKGLQEDPADNGQPCERVSEQNREQAIALLAEAPAVALGAAQYKHLTGAALPASNGTPYLLRGFSTVNSEARVTVVGNAVTVHSDALGGLFELRRHPCIAALKSAPSEVYTVAAYDL